MQIEPLTVAIIGCLTSLVLLATSGDEFVAVVRAQNFKYGRPSYLPWVSVSSRHFLEGFSNYWITLCRSFFYKLSTSLNTFWHHLLKPPFDLRVHFINVLNRRIQNNGARCIVSNADTIRVCRFNGEVVIMKVHTEVKHFSLGSEFWFRKQFKLKLECYFNFFIRSSFCDSSQIFLHFFHSIRS